MTWIDWVIDLLIEMELDLFLSMQRNLKRHRLDEIKEGFKWTQWQAIQMKNLREYREELARRVNRTFEEINPLIEQEIEKAFIDGADTFDQELIDAYQAMGKEVPWEALPMADTLAPARWSVKADPKPHVITLEPPSDRSFFVVHQEQLEIVLNDVRRDMNVARYGAAQHAGTIYEDIVKRADVMFQTGSYSIQQAVEKAAGEAAKAGLNCIEYADGRRVNIASYTEMALRTSARRAQMTAQGKKRDEWEEYLVISPTLHSTCDTCQPWQGKVLIDDVFASGKPDGKHPLLSEAIEPPSHFLGPNCRHPLSTYFEGVTQIPEASPWDKTAANYQAEEQQRYFERKIREWKRRQAIATTDEAEAEAEGKVKEWQGRIRRHIHENPQLRRNPAREKLLGLIQEREEGDTA